MKILSANQIRIADQYTIDNEPIKSIDLMERAAGICFAWILENIERDWSCVHVFCGLGNNGGDGLVLARLFTELGIDVQVYVLRYSKTESPDFQTNFKRLQKTDAHIHEVNSAKINVEVNVDHLIVDAIFGSGLTRSISGWLKSVIQQINSLPAFKIAIDIPSGLFVEFNNDNDLSAVIQADITLSLQSPKLALLLEESGKYCGEWEVLDIGLNQEIIDELPSDYRLITEDFVRQRIKFRSKFSFKNNYGHALLVAGSLGKVGAAVLSARACLKGGAGLLTIYSPQCGVDILQTSVPEAMVIPSIGQESLQSIPEDLSAFTTIGIGPGIGTSAITATAVEGFISTHLHPLVIDADALNIISEHKTWLKRVTKNSILTPHVGEFKRLVGDWEDDKEKLKKQLTFSKKHELIIVLKGAHTSISTPEGTMYFNSTGNPGMAAAGSGDVLLGLITGMLARGYQPIEAACMGVYIHGLAGDAAASQVGEESMVAGDIVNNIAEAYLYLSNE